MTNENMTLCSEQELSEMYNYAKVILTKQRGYHPHEAEDILQDAYINATRYYNPEFKNEKGSGPCSFRSFFLRYAISRVSHSYRRTQYLNFKKISDSIDAPLMSENSELGNLHDILECERLSAYTLIKNKENSNLKHYLLRVIKQNLTPNQAFVIKSYYFDGMSYKSIGNALNTSREWVRQVKNKALKKLQYIDNKKLKQCLNNFAD